MTIILPAFIKAEIKDEKMISIKRIKITAIDNKRIPTPAGQSWDDWFDAPGVSSDFITDRKQPEDQLRSIF